MKEMPHILVIPTWYPKGREALMGIYHKTFSKVLAETGKVKVNMLYVDRVGVKLGFGFPAGVEVSRLAARCDEPIRPKSTVRGMQCSLSGLENQCNALLAAGKSPEYVC